MICSRPYPQDLAHQQILQVLTALRIAGQQQDLGGGGEHEYHADDRLLDFRPFALSVQVSRSAPSRAAASAETCTATPCGSKPTKSAVHHADSGDLGDGDVDEHDAAGQHLHAQRHVGRSDQQDLQPAREG